MYKNLIKALNAKGLSYYAAGATIGMPEATFRGKIEGKVKSGFSVEEAFSIKINIFPEMDIMYLFDKAEIAEPA